jgi:hypothetical protein
MKVTIHLCEIMTQNTITIQNHRVSPNCRRSSQTWFSDSNRTHLNSTLSLATAARSSHQPTARCRHRQHPGQQGGDKRLVLLGGEVPRVLPVVLVEVVAAAAAAAVGGPRQRVGVLHGVEAQVLGHPLQRGDGAPIQQHLLVLLVRGVQQAVAGGQAVQLETTLAGVVQIRKHRAVGTCDGYCLRPRRLCVDQ